MIRRSGSWTLHGVGATLPALLASCIQIGGTMQRRLIDLNEGTMAQRTELAQEYATGNELDVLRASAKRHFPRLTDADVATLGLSWQRMVMGDGDHVMVVVTFMPASETVDAGAVADFVAGEVKKELQSRLKSKKAAPGPSALVAPPNKALKLTRSAMGSDGAALAA